MKRKVIKQGHDTLTVTLPKKWCKDYSISAGDDISVDENGSMLQVYAQKGINLNAFRKSVSRTSLSHLKSIISNAYKKGYDTIILDFDDDTVLKDIQKVVDTLMGIEIVSKGKNSCEIKNIAETFESELDNLIKNVFITIMEMANEVLEYIRKNDRSKLADIVYKREFVTKYTELCKRILNKHKKNEKTMIFQYLIIWGLEKIANEYKYIYNFYVEYKVSKVSRYSLDYFSETNKILNTYFEAYYRVDHKKIWEIAQKKDEMLYRQYYALQPKLTSKEQPIVHHLAVIVRRLWDISGPFHGMYS
jgi:phosphate uptake regulator